MMAATIDVCGYPTNFHSLWQSNSRIAFGDRLDTTERAASRPASALKCWLSRTRSSFAVTGTEARAPLDILTGKVDRFIKRPVNVWSAGRAIRFDLMNNAVR